MNRLAFRVLAQGPSGARAGVLTTPHGDVLTPAFMPVGTQATVKGLTPGLLAETGARAILANAFHLAARPGVDLIARMGGLHRFMGWDGAIITDSGGFQVFSLAPGVVVSDEGVEFSAPVDGAKVFLTPERSMADQEALGADVAMCLDECPPAQATRDEAAQAVRRSLMWANQARRAHGRPDQALFGIVQGGIHRDLREESAAGTRDLDMDGYAIGGLSVGEERTVFREVLAFTAPLLPRDRPRYLMGVGRPADIEAGVAAGVDLFDCVIPTRNARNGSLFTSEGEVHIKNARFQEDPLPPDPACDCATCARFSRAYLRHLFMSREMLGPILATVHNVRFFVRYVAGLRDAILTGP